MFYAGAYNGVKKVLIPTYLISVLAYCIRLTAMGNDPPSPGLKGAFCLSEIPRQARDDMSRMIGVGDRMMTGVG